MLRLAGDSVGRAMLVVVGFLAAGLALAVVIGVVAALLDDAGQTRAMVVVCSLAVVALSPFMVVCLSPASAQAPWAAATEQGDLAARGAPVGVARTIAWAGAVLSVVPGLACVVTFGAVALVVGPGGAAG